MSRFKPGVSGNPSGRPKVPLCLRNLYRMGAMEGAQLALKYVRDEEQDPKLRMTATQFLTERAYGRPAQQMELSGPQGGPLEMVAAKYSDEELYAALQERIKKLGLLGDK